MYILYSTLMQNELDFEYYQPKWLLPVSDLYSKFCTQFISLIATMRADLFSCMGQSQALNVEQKCTERTKQT